MGNKMDHVSTSKLRHALDLSIADLADKDAANHGATSVIQVRKAKATLDEMTNRPPVLDRDQPEAPHVSWTQRVLSWFKRD